jgi:hypothetical protein
MSSDVIIAARGAAESVRGLQIDNLAPRAGRAANPGAYAIRHVACTDTRHSASRLLNRMYARRGYASSGLGNTPLSHSITLSAGEGTATVGTLSVGFDAPGGLLVDQCFPEETARLRAEGRRLCEFKKLAVDSGPHSKQVLASLFHVAYVAAHRLRGCDNVLIEINPRHVGYYRRMLGFEVLGSERLNPRVDAPALLLSLDLAHAEAQIARLGGQPERASQERSLYPWFHAAADEPGIASRLQAATGRAEPRQPAAAPMVM